MISFEEAKQMAEAEFPQPTFQFGQFWYDTMGVLWCIGRLSSPDSELKAICLEDTRWEHLWDTRGFIYAATEQDILVPLQAGARRGFWWSLTPPQPDDATWSCHVSERNEGRAYEHREATSTSACVRAFLMLHKAQKLNH